MALAPWTVVVANVKDHGRLNAPRAVLEAADPRGGRGAVTLIFRFNSPPGDPMKGAFAEQAINMRIRISAET